MTDSKNIGNYSRLSVDPTLGGMVDGVDFPHTGVFKALAIAAQGNFAILNSATSVMAENFSIVQTDTGDGGDSNRTTQFVVGSGMVMRDGKAILVPAGSGTTTFNTGTPVDFNPPTSTGNGYFLLVVEVDSSGVHTLAIRDNGNRATLNTVPQLTAGDIPVAMIRLAHAESGDSRLIQYFTTAKSENSVSIGYNASTVYTEVGTLQGVAGGTTLESTIGALTLTSEDDVTVKLGGTSATDNFTVRDSGDEVQFSVDGAGSVNIPSLTGSEIVITNSAKTLISADVGTYPSLAELAHVKGVSSAIQTQLDSKLLRTGDQTLTGSILIDKDRVATVVGAEDITALHVDFDRTVPNSGTAAHNDIGIDLDVTSASLGTSTVVGLDIDVVGATTGTQTVTGLTVDVSGSNDNNYSALFNGGFVGIGNTAPIAPLHITTADNLPQLLLESTDDDANVGPELLLKRNTSPNAAADNDLIGKITFQGMSVVDGQTTTATVDYVDISTKILDKSDGSEDAEFEISAFVAGTKRSILLHGVDSDNLETVFNEDSQDINFRVEGNTDVELIVADAGEDKVGIGITPTSGHTSKLTLEGSMMIKERPAATVDLASYGQLWVKESTPNELYFTNDAGNDIQLTSGSSGSGGDITSVFAGDGLTGGATSGAATLNVVGGAGITASANEILITDGGVTMAKLANIATDTFIGRTASNTGVPKALSKAEALEILDVADGANNYIHPDHSGDITSNADGDTVIANNVVDEAKLNVSNAPTNGYFLSAQSGNTGGLTWAAVSAGSGDITSVVAGTGLTGGANSGDATVNVIGGDGITANADEIEVTVDDSTIDLSATNGAGAIRVKDGGIVLAKMAENSVDSDQYVDASIDAEHLAADAVITAKILDANVTTAKIADDAVTYAKMQNLGTADRVLGSTSAGVIGETQVVTDMIATDAVTNAKIADGAVDTEHIAADAIEEEHIGDGEVKTVAIANSNVTLAKLANIADDRVLGNISGSAAAPAELTAANLRTLLTVADGSLSQNNFTNTDHSKLDGIAASANNYVHPDHSGEVTSNADGATTIATGAVVADRIAADAVTTVKILNANVTTAKIADDAVTADKLAADAVVNASVAAGAAITFAKLEPLDSTKMLVGNGSNVATEVAISGDVTMANDGAVTIANDAVTGAKLANNIDIAGTLDVTGVTTLDNNLIVSGVTTLRANVLLKTAAFSATIAESGTVYQLTNAGAVVVTLPADPTIGCQYVFVNVNGNNMVITPALGDIINGTVNNTETNATAYAATSCVCVVGGGTAQWLVFGGI